MPKNIILNPILKEEVLTPIQMPFKPTEVRCKDDLTFDEDGEHFLYSAIVRECNTAKWHIFEFDQIIMDALEAYRFRHSTIQTVELLLSRFKDGTLRISIGRSDVSPARERVSAAEYEKMENVASRLTNFYIKHKHTNYKIHL